MLYSASAPSRGQASQFTCNSAPKARPSLSHKPSQASQCARFDADLAIWGAAPSTAELSLEGIGQGVLLELNMKYNCASPVPDRIEHHWNAITVIQPNPHMVESASQLSRIDP